MRLFVALLSLVLITSLSFANSFPEPLPLIQIPPDRGYVRDMKVGEKGYTYGVIFDLKKNCYINIYVRWGTQQKMQLGSDVLIERKKQGYIVRNISRNPSLCSDITSALKDRVYKKVLSYSGFNLCIMPQDLKVGQRCWMDSWSIRQDERGKYWLNTDYSSHNYYRLEPLKRPINPSYKWSKKHCQVERRRDGYHIYFDIPIGTPKPPKLARGEKKSCLPVTVHIE